MSCSRPCLEASGRNRKGQKKRNSPGPHSSRCSRLGTYETGLCKNCSVSVWDSNRPMQKDRRWPPATPSFVLPSQLISDRAAEYVYNPARIGFSSSLNAGLPVASRESNIGYYVTRALVQ